MKNQLIILSSLFLVLLFSSCGDDSCAQQDWLGTWNLVGEDECESGSTTHFANDDFELEAGSTIDMIKIESSEFQLDADGCLLRLDDLILRLSEDELTVNYDDGCSFKYTKG